ncbi:uncharacterized protein [Palaemon carinicauda]|uniref:uncharacterized protein n=1 Tax=Palaemon carinicauda TaxID=392227 RepID=UPI0035B67A7A
MPLSQEVVSGIQIFTFIVTESREKVTDFAWIFQNYPSLLISRSPKEKNQALSALSPFQLKVWLFLIVSFLSMGPFVYTISYLVNRYLTYDAQNDIQWYAFNMFRIIVNQGIFIRERSWPIRAILSFYLIFCIVFSAYELPINSLEELPRAVKDGFTVGLLDGSSYEIYFLTSPAGIIKQTWLLFDHEERSNSFVDSASTGIRRLSELARF